MRAKVARRLRKSVYGDFSLRARKYYHHPKIPGTIITDRRRQEYQRVKKAYKQGLFIL